MPNGLDQGANLHRKTKLLMVLTARIIHYQAE
jgi:hypothetical protein